MTHVILLILLERLKYKWFCEFVESSICSLQRLADKFVMPCELKILECNFSLRSLSVSSHCLPLLQQVQIPS